MNTSGILYYDLKIYITAVGKLVKRNYYYNMTNRCHISACIVTIRQYKEGHYMELLKN